MSRPVAAVWRASWRRASRTPAAFRSSFHLWWSVFGFKGSPVGEVNTYPFSVHRSRARARSRAWFSRCDGGAGAVCQARLIGRWPARDFAPFVSRRDVDLLGAKPRLSSAAVAAPVLVAGPQPATPYADDAELEVDVVPLHAEDFSLPEAEGKRDDPAGGVTVLARFGQNALDLPDRVRLDLLLFDLGRLGHGGQVGREVLAATCGSQARPRAPSARPTRRACSSGHRPSASSSPPSRLATSICMPRPA